MFVAASSSGPPAMRSITADRAKAEMLRACASLHFTESCSNSISLMRKFTSFVRGFMTLNLASIRLVPNFGHAEIVRKSPTGSHWMKTTLFGAFFFERFTLRIPLDSRAGERTCVCLQTECCARALLFISDRSKA